MESAKTTLEKKMGKVHLNQVNKGLSEHLARGSPHPGHKCTQLVQWTRMAQTYSIGKKQP